MKAKHPKRLYRKSHDRVARDMASLRYDALALCLDSLSYYIEKDAEKDILRNRPLLAHKLVDAAAKLLDASEKMREAWDICEPRMKGK